MRRVTFHVPFVPSRRRLNTNSPVKCSPRRRHGGMLLLIDNVPLQAAAWRELCHARRRLEKATRDLHRHEQIDEPGFRAWLGSTFPDLVSAIREFTQQIAAKSRIVQAVESESWISGRTPRSIWRRWQREAAQPASEDADPVPPAGGSDDSDGFDVNGGDPFDDETTRDIDSERQAFDALFEEFCAMNGLDPDDPVANAMRERAARMAGFDFGVAGTRSAPNPAREIYRRLVQQLHPDRGGAWTPQRAALWHQVQEAWEARDADMLARLESEWEIAADTLGPGSPLGRLRAALNEIQAARRDAERKVRQYRKTPAWRFSLTPPGARSQDGIHRELTEQRDVLRRELSHFETVIAAWERPMKRRRQRSRAHDWTAQPAFAFSFDVD